MDAAAAPFFSDVALQDGVVWPPVWQACLWDETDFMGRSFELLLHPFLLDTLAANQWP